MVDEPTAEEVREALEWLENEESMWHLFSKRPSPPESTTPEQQRRREQMYRTRRLALTLARRGAAREEVEFARVDRHGVVWTRYGTDSRWKCGGATYDTTADLDAAKGPLRPLYAGPVEDNDGGV